MIISVTKQGTKLCISALVTVPTTGVVSAANPITAKVYTIVDGALVAVDGLSAVALSQVDDDGVYFGSASLPTGIVFSTLYVVVRATVSAAKQAAVWTAGGLVGSGPAINVTTGVGTTI